MKKSKFAEAQIVFAIKQSETGVAVAEICRNMGSTDATFYNWKKKYGGLGISELRELRQLKVCLNYFSVKWLSSFRIFTSVN